MASRIPLALAGLLILALAAACGPREAPEIDARLSVAEALAAGDDAGYARALEVRDLTFPADHGPHPDFRTEWWYFTGNLVAVDGDGDGGSGDGGEPRRFGYQLTFFRSAVAPPPMEPARDRGAGEAAPDSDWHTRQIYMAHFALTDVAGGRFHAAQRFARGAAGLSGAVADPFRVWTGGWEAYRDAAPGENHSGPGAAPATPPPPGDPDRGGTGRAGPGGGEEAPADGLANGRPDGGGDGLFPLRLVAADGEVAVDLLLEAGKGRVLQGDLGLSQKGAEPGNASYYYTYPRMPTGGTVTVGGTTYRVEGASWLDREWSTSVLGEGKAGWDWFAVQLDDGREVVAYRIRSSAEAGTLREGSGSLDYAALVPADPDQAGPGRLRVLDAAAGSLEVTRRWTSPDSGVTYPAGWRLRLPDAGLDLELRPRLDDQELDLAFRYWEGSVAVTGSAGGRPVIGQGYAELTGYGDAAPRTR